MYLHAFNCIMTKGGTKIKTESKLNMDTITASAPVVFNLLGTLLI